MIQSRTTVITISVNLVPETDFQGFSGLFISKAHFSHFFFFNWSFMFGSDSYSSYGFLFLCVCVWGTFFL